MPVFPTLNPTSQSALKCSAALDQIAISWNLVFSWEHLHTEDFHMCSLPGAAESSLLLLLEVSSPSSAPLNFLLILAGTWGQSVRVPSPALGRAGPPESLFDLLWLLTQGGL